MKVARLALYALMASVASFHLYATPLARAQSPAEIVSPVSGQERLTGEPAFAHLEKLQARRQKDFDAAARELNGRGFTKTDEVTVIRSAGGVRGSGAAGRSKVLPVQSFGSASGEIVFWSWDDGNAATWEGVMYVENYGSGATATWNVQMDVSTEYFDVLWEHLAASSGGGGSLELLTSAPSCSPASEVPQIASLSLEIPLADAEHSDFELVQSAPSARRWLNCVWQRCGARSLRCVWSGPACVAHQCGWDAIDCAIQEMM